MAWHAEQCPQCRENRQNHVPLPEALPIARTLPHHPLTVKGRHTAGMPRPAGGVEPLRLCRRLRLGRHLQLHKPHPRGGAAAAAGRGRAASQFGLLLLATVPLFAR